MSVKDDEIKTVKALEKVQNPEDDTITLSTGVVLRGKQVPTLILVKLMAAFPRPKVPTWINPNMGREMENPDDPDYLERIRAWKVESSNVTLNALVLLGTELVKVPKKMNGPDDNDWIDEYKLLGLPMYPENKSWRYLTWITFRAAPALDDLNLLKEVVGRLSGIPENKVEAAETFPGSDQAHR